MLGPVLNPVAQEADRARECGNENVKLQDPLTFGRGDSCPSRGTSCKNPEPQIQSNLTSVRGSVVFRLDWTAKIGRFKAQNVGPYLPKGDIITGPEEDWT